MIAIRTLTHPVRVSTLALTALLMSKGVWGAIVDPNNTVQGTMNSGDTAEFAHVGVETGDNNSVRIPDNVNVGAGGIVVTNIGANGSGKVEIEGNTTATGTIGATGAALGILDFRGVTGKVATVTGASYIYQVNVTGEPAGAGTLEFQGLLRREDPTTGAAATFFKNGVLVIGGNSSHLGAVDHDEDEATKGTVRVSGTGVTVASLGDAGSERRVNLDIRHNDATNVTGAARTAISFGAGTGTTSIVDFQSTAGGNINIASVTNASGTNNRGKVQFANTAGTNTVLGDIGGSGATASVGEVVHNGAAGRVDLQGSVYAEYVTFGDAAAIARYSGATTSTIAASHRGGLGAHGVVEVTGTNKTFSGVMGSNTDGLAAVNIESGGDAIFQNNIKATDVAVKNGGTFEMNASAARTITGAWNTQAGGTSYITVSGAGSVAHVGNFTNAGTFHLGGYTLTHSGGTLTWNTGTIVSTITTTGNGKIATSGTLNPSGAVTVKPKFYDASSRPNATTSYTVVDGGGTAGGLSNITVTPEGALAQEGATGAVKRSWTKSLSGGDLILTYVVEAAPTVVSSLKGAVTEAMKASSAVATALESNPKVAHEVTPVVQTVVNDAAKGITNSVGSIIALISGGPDAAGVGSASTPLFRYGAAAKGGNAGSSTRGLGAWAQGFGTSAKQKRRKSAEGYDAQSHGGAVGADVRLDDDLKLGVSAAFAQSKVDEKNNRSGSGMKIRSYVGTLYGRYNIMQPWYLDGQVGYARHDSRSHRTVTTVGVANAKYLSQQYFAKAETGYGVDIDAGHTVTPFVSVGYDHLNQPGYTESGATAMTVKGNKDDSVRSGVGLRYEGTIKMEEGWSFKPSVHGAWNRDLTTKATATTARYVAGGAEFRTQGDKPAADAFNAGLGLGLDDNQGLSATINYNAEIKDKYLGHAAALKVRFEF